MNVVARFCLKTNNHDENEYLFNGKKLNISITVQGEGLYHGSEISVACLKKIIGGNK